MKHIVRLAAISIIIGVLGCNVVLADTASASFLRPRAFGDRKEQAIIEGISRGQLTSRKFYSTSIFNEMQDSRRRLKELSYDLGSLKIKLQEAVRNREFGMRRIDIKEKVEWAQSMLLMEVRSLTDKKIITRELAAEVKNIPDLERGYDKRKPEGEQLVSISEQLISIIEALQNFSGAVISSVEAETIRLGGQLVESMELAQLGYFESLEPSEQAYIIKLHPDRIMQNISAALALGEERGGISESETAAASAMLAWRIKTIEPTATNEWALTEGKRFSAAALFMKQLTPGPQLPLATPDIAETLAAI